MAKNEAKIKFTAETGSFNDSIKQANNTMSQLRAEMKLNETQMKATGTTIEGLENKHKILSAQLDASADKTAALSAKVDKAVEIFGENSDEASKLKVQLLNAQNAEEKLRQSVNACEIELKQQRATANQTETAVEGLSDTISRQETELKQLKREYVDAVGQFGDTSTEAKQLEKAISNLSTELADNKRKFSDASEQADKLDKSMGDAKNGAKDAGGGFTTLKGTIANLAADAIQNAIGKLAEFTSWLKGLPSETAEARADMATLSASYDKAGFSAEQAAETQKNMYKVIGEDDRAVEVSNWIAKLSDDQQDLNNWTTIATGIWGQFQDSLPIEGLAEDALETGRVGKATGTMVDALLKAEATNKQWSKALSGNKKAQDAFSSAVESGATKEEAFNEALAACSSEQERNELIQGTLMGLYSDSADIYNEATQSLQGAREAEAELNETQREIAETLEPVTTEFTNLKNEMLEGMQPAIETISGLMLDALEWMEEHPTATQAVATAFGVFAIGLGAAAVAVGIYTAAQWAMNTAILANPITWVVIGIIAAIAAVIGIGVALYKNWDKIKAKCKEFADDIKKKFNDLKNKVVNFVTGIKDGVVNKFNELKNKGTQLIEGAKSAVVNKFNALKSGALSVVDALKSAVSARFSLLKSLITNPVETARSIIKSTVDKIKGYFNFSWSLPKPKIPKFSVSGGKAPWGFGGKGSLPKVSIKWNKLGAIVNRPTLVGTVGNTIMGAGEAGAEAIMPISLLQDYINRAFDRNVLAYAAAGGSGDVYNFYVDDATINDNAQMQKVAKNFLEEILRLGGMNR